VNLEKLYKNNPIQYQIYGLLSIGILGITTILYLTDKEPYHRFIGNLNPIVVFILLILAGFLALSYLISQQWFSIYKQTVKKAFKTILPIAGFIGIIVIILDLMIRFPADTNILFPNSLLFYPSIAFLVEIIFHIFPLIILLGILKPLIKPGNRNRIIWISLMLIAFVESGYHLVYMLGSDFFTDGIATIIFSHILIINIVQLAIFKKYDFISMYSFRLVYYAIWHIGWGYLRLSTLF